jgi:hypothetical protein
MVCTASLESKTCSCTDIDSLINLWTSVRGYLFKNWQGAAFISIQIQCEFIKYKDLLIKNGPPRKRTWAGRDSVTLISTCFWLWDRGKEFKGFFFCCTRVGNLSRLVQLRKGGRWAILPEGVSLQNWTSQVWIIELKPLPKSVDS